MIAGMKQKQTNKKQQQQYKKVTRLLIKNKFNFF